MNEEAQNLRAARIAFAAELKEFEEQQRWYSERAGQFKSRSQWIDLAILLAGALIAAFPAMKLLDGVVWPEIVVPLLGALVVVCQGAQRVFRYAETWLAYRRASERMKHEWRAFIHAVPPYGAEDEEAARIAYVAALQEAIAEEQQLFFDDRRNRDPANDR